ncbi:uncharacterized protein LOC125532837 [Triticum urartu]|uniref:uncharacterized protein LOC125532837 n=1 Tax=Triticum urartu TaxID=4572 RepID=UPI002043A509|nr:uncharacterized protein LOC125532837 [Triticum urartu]
MATRSEARVVEVSGEGDSRQMRVSNAGQWRPQLRPRRSSWWRSNEVSLWHGGGSNLQLLSVSESRSFWKNPPWHPPGRCSSVVSGVDAASSAEETSGSGEATAEARHGESRWKREGGEARATRGQSNPEARRPGWRRRSGLNKVDQRLNSVSVTQNWSKGTVTAASGAASRAPQVNKTSVRRRLTAAGRSTGIDSRSAQRRTAVGAVQRAEAWQLDGALWQRGSSRGEPPSKSTIRRSGHGGEGRGRGSKPARQLSHTAVKPVEAKRGHGGSVMVQPQKMGGRWRTATSGHGSKMSRDGGSVMNKAMAV